MRVALSAQSRLIYAEINCARLCRDLNLFVLLEQIVSGKIEQPDADRSSERLQLVGHNVHVDFVVMQERRDQYIVVKTASVVLQRLPASVIIDARPRSEEHTS